MTSEEEPLPARYFVFAGMYGVLSCLVVGLWLDFLPVPVLFALQLLATYLGMTLVLRTFRLRWYAKHPPLRPSFAPVDIDHPDPLVRHAVAQAWNTGKSVVGYRDEDGKLRIEEREPERTPVVRIDQDGTVIDGTAAVQLIMTDTGLSVRLVDARDLDGELLVLPPQSRLEAKADLKLPPEIAMAIARDFTTNTFHGDIGVFLVKRVERLLHELAARHDVELVTQRQGRHGLNVRLQVNVKGPSENVDAFMAAAKEKFS